MKIWLDTTNIELITAADSAGFLFGVTTNPALIAQSGKSMKEVLRSLLDCQDGPITAQVLDQTAEGMIEQGKKLYDFSDRIIVKVPVTEQGLKAIHVLSHEQISVMATVVFEPHQALLAALAGAHYVAPYVGQIDKNGKNPWDILKSMLTIFQNNQIKTQILAASISTIEQVTKCAEIGIQHITLKDDTFKKLISTVSLTQERVDHFTSVWNESKATFI